MDEATWMALSNDVEPLLRGLKQIALKYQLGTNGLNIYADVDQAWAFIIDEFDVHYNVNIDSNDVMTMTDNKKMFVKE